MPKIKFANVGKESFNVAYIFLMIAREGSACNDANIKGSAVLVKLYERAPFMRTEQIT